MTTQVPAKGEYGGPCNRSACLDPGAKYFNHANRLHYCAACAHELNTDRFTVRDAEGWWGKGMRFCEYRPTAEPLPEREWIAT